MDPLLLNFITAFTMKLIGQFKHRNDELTEDEIRSSALAEFNSFNDDNKKLLHDALAKSLNPAGKS